MGRMAALDMIEHAEFDQALRWHLKGNHFPPKEYMYDSAVAAIEAGKERDFFRQIDLPEGVSYLGQATAPAGNLIGSLHLEDFLDLEEDFEYE